MSSLAVAEEASLQARKVSLCHKIKALTNMDLKPSHAQGVVA